MRDRPFIGGGESPRPFGEILAERRQSDPEHRRREITMDHVVALEGEASEAADPVRAKDLQCQAEALRAALDEHTTRRS